VDPQSQTPTVVLAAGVVTKPHTPIFNVQPPFEMPLSELKDKGWTSDGMAAQTEQTFHPHRVA